MMHIKDKAQKYHLIVQTKNQFHCSNRETALFFFAISESTVENAIRWFSSGCPIADKTGPKPKLTDNIKTFIVVRTFANPTVPGDELSFDINNRFHIKIGKTVINEFRRSVNFKYLPRIRVIFLNDVAKQRRVNFAIWYLQSGLDHQKIPFSDEKWFYLDSLNGKCWRSLDEV